MFDFGSFPHLNLLQLKIFSMGNHETEEKMRIFSKFRLNVAPFFVHTPEKFTPWDFQIRLRDLQICILSGPGTLMNFDIASNVTRQWVSGVLQRAEQRRRLQFAQVPVPSIEWREDWFLTSWLDPGFWSVDLWFYNQNSNPACVTETPLTWISSPS